MNTFVGFKVRILFLPGFLNERNDNGGFRPVWILVDKEKTPIQRGVQINIVETRTMLDNPSDIQVKRPYRATVGEDGLVTYGWHWNSGWHLDMAKYKWHLSDYGNTLYVYEGDGDVLYISKGN